MLPKTGIAVPEGAKRQAFHQLQASISSSSYSETTRLLSNGSAFAIHSSENDDLVGIAIPASGSVLSVAVAHNALDYFFRGTNEAHSVLETMPERVGDHARIISYISVD